MSCPPPRAAAEAAHGREGRGAGSSGTRWEAPKTRKMRCQGFLFILTLKTFPLELTLTWGTAPLRFPRAPTGLPVDRTFLGPWECGTSTV